jgi:hypothetical protein
MRIKIYDVGDDGTETLIGTFIVGYPVVPGTSTYSGCPVSEL